MTLILEAAKLSGGPEIWTTEQLTELCDKIWVNSLAIICALALYGINSRELAKGRGWGEPASSPALREQDYKRMLQLFGDSGEFISKTIHVMPEIYI